MPFPNFHSGRVKDPSDFESESFKYVKLKGTSVETVMGKLKGESAMTVQAYRFPKSEYTASEAKAWLKAKDIKTIKFEAASEDSMAGNNIKSKVEGVGRFDTIDSMQWMCSTFQRTTEGFLKGRAIVTSVGVFEYKNADGSSQFELRLPEEVFNYDSLESLKLKPLANDHPKEAVTPENISKYQVGSLGDNPGSATGDYDYKGSFVDFKQRTDGMHLAIDMVVTEAGAIQDVINGKQALSCGYTCDLEESSGRWCGVHYDYIQRRIRYNHVAIVDEARAGDAAKIRLDSKDAVLVNINTKEASNMAGAMKKITLDGVEYEGEAELIKTLSVAQKKADELTTNLDAKDKDMSKLTAEHDALKDKFTKLQDANTELQKAYDKLKAQMEKDPDDEECDDKKGDSADAVNPMKERIDKAVTKRLMVLGAAAKAGIEKVDGVSNKELMKQTIMKVSPDAKLDGKDNVYIAARFDAVVEQLNAEAINNDGIRLMGNPPVPVTEIHADGATTQKGPRTSEQARQDMIDRMTNKKEDK